MKKNFFVNHNIAFKKLKTTSELWHYTAGNIGNAYIGYASIKMLTGRFGKVDGIPNLWNFDQKAIDVNFVNRNYSKVILCMQDQIRVDESYYRPDYTRICDFLEKIQLPFVVLSLGANAIQSEYDTELRQVPAAPPNAPPEESPCARRAKPARSAGHAWPPGAGGQNR